MKINKRRGRSLLLVIASIILHLVLNSELFKEGLVVDGRIKTDMVLFFGIISMENAVDRRMLMKKVWTDKIIDKGYDYVYITDKKINDTYKWTPTVQFLDRRGNANRNREYKRLTSAKYFLENTNAEFLVMPGDDVFIDIDRIDEFA